MIYGAIVGSIAEAYYGVPKSLKEKCDTFLTPQILEMVKLIEEVFE